MLLLLRLLLMLLAHSSVCVYVCVYAYVEIERVQNSSANIYTNETQQNVRLGKTTLIAYKTLMAGSNQTVDTTIGEYFPFEIFKFEIFILENV